MLGKGHQKNKLQKTGAQDHMSDLPNLLDTALDNWGEGQWKSYNYVVIADFDHLQYWKGSRTPALPPYTKLLGLLWKYEEGGTAKSFSHT